MAQTFDVVVIGGGPGGYVAAIRAAQLGLKTACIDDWKTPDGRPALGGTCTNIGCIPSKALLQSSENFEQAGHGFADHGVRVKGLELDLAQMLKRKDQVVKASNDGVVYLFKKNKVAFFHGRGSFVKAGTEGCEIAVGEETLSARNVIIATGSSPRALSGAAFDEKLVLSNDGALAIPEVLPVFLSAADEQIAREAWKIFTKQGLKIELGVKITGVKAKKDATVEYADAQGKAQSAAFDRLIVSIGRVPNTSGLNAEGVGLKLDERGFIAVDENCRTNLPGVWAIGDVVRGPMLAHKAEEEGAAVAERIAGQRPHVDFNTIPWVIYTAPEIAWVGKTEQQLKAEGIEYRAGTFPFSANARARALGETSGMVKFLADAKTDAVLGVHIMGAFASELIAEAVVAMEFRSSSEDIGIICHAHPSLSEAMKDAALAVDKRALNI